MMRKIVMVLFILTIMLFPIEVNASAGAIKKDTIIECDGKLYGQHGSDNHWHAVDENGKAKGANLGVNFSCDTLIKTEKLNVTLSKCVDGDTARFKIDNEEIVTRFLAVDTPETVHPTKGVEPYGKEASSYTCETLTNAKKIQLEYDSGSTKIDNYERHLVWVWVDGELLQENLVSKGLAKVAYLYGDYKYTERLEEAENIAKNNQLGIWFSEEPIEETDKETTTDLTEINPFIILVITFFAILILFYLKEKFKKIKK